MVEPMTKQEVFNKVAKHLLKQGERALTKNGTCQFHVPDSKMRCAVGCLITKRYYKVDMEFHSPEGLFVEFPKEMKNLRLNKRRHKIILDELQELHDNDYTDPEDWSEELKKLAQNHKLKHDFIKVKKEEK